MKIYQKLKFRHPCVFKSIALHRIKNQPTQGMKNQSNGIHPAAATTNYPRYRAHTSNKLRGIIGKIPDEIEMPLSRRLIDNKAVPQSPCRRNMRAARILP